MSIDAKHMLLSEFGAKGHGQGSDVWNFGTDTKTIKLSLILLVYLYANDDGKISFSEKRSFKKVINSINELTFNDKREIMEILDKLPDKSYVMRYIRENELSDAVVLAAINFLRGKAKLNKKYISLLTDIERQYKK